VRIGQDRFLLFFFSPPRSSPVRPGDGVGAVAAVTVFLPFLFSEAAIKSRWRSGTRLALFLLFQFSSPPVRPAARKTRKVEERRNGDAERFPFFPISPFTDSKRKGKEGGEREGVLFPS